MKQPLSDFFRSLRYAARPLTAGGRGHAAGAAVPARILLASTREGDRTGLRGILNKARWTIVEAGHWTEALSLAEQTVFSVALCDRDLPGMDWKEGVRRLRKVRESPATILLSNVADPYLWEALVSAGAFDVLTRPFRESEAVSMIEFAFTHWKTGQTGRRSEASGRP